jgi:hypothetical protein
MASRAVLRLASRYADCERSPFGSDSTGHVSLYRRA